MRKRLNEVLPLEVGLFTHIDKPMWESHYQAFDMDLEFITSYGQKLISPLTEYYAKQGEITEADAKKLMTMIYRKFEESWKRKYEVLDVQYIIKDNYSMRESETTDRDTLETTIRELLRTNTEASTQINDLINILENDLTNTRKKTGTDTIDSNYENRDIVDETDDVTSSGSSFGTDVTSFNNRKDTETRDLTKDGTSKDTIKGTKSDTLSFTDRKDASTGNEKLKGNDTETGNSSGKDDTGKYGFGSIEVAPETQVKTSNDTELAKVVDHETTSSGSLTKTGSEKNTITDDTVNDGLTTEKDKGTISNEKTGSEEVSRDGNTSESSLTNRTGNNESRGNNDSTTTYDTTDTDSQTGTSTNKNTGTVNNDTTSSGDERSNDEVVGQVNERRTIERTGNIGVTTTTDLLQQHIDFWKFSFLDGVYKDVVGMLTLEIY